MVSDCISDEFGMSIVHNLGVSKVVLGILDVYDQCETSQEQIYLLEKGSPVSSSVPQCFLTSIKQQKWYIKWRFLIFFVIFGCFKPKVNCSAMKTIVKYELSMSVGP